MWITQPVFHNHIPGNSKIQSSTSIKPINKGENQRAGHTLEKTIVDNSQVLAQSGGKLLENGVQNSQNSGLKEVLKGELDAIKSDLSTMANADKQREKSGFSEIQGQSGQVNDRGLWKTEKLSTMTVDNLYSEAKNNPFKAGMLLKKHIAMGLDADNERMLFNMMVKLDLKCEKDVCEIRIMDKLMPILENNVDKIEKHSCGFKIKIIGIQTFTASTQVEVDKIKKYFGEEYLKMVDTLSK